MDFNSKKIVEVLEEQRRFHQEQLRLIEIALAAIEAGGEIGAKTAAENGAKARQSNRVSKHRIQWTKEIERFLDDYDDFIIMDLQRDLAEKRGIASAMTIQGRNVINNTLNRFERKGRIQKLRPGVYKVIKGSISS